MSTARILLPALLLGCVLTSCATVPEAERDIVFERELPLTAPVAAFVVADAVRAALPFADPLPYSGGAPATQIDRGRYLVRYQKRGTSWLPSADHRLLLPHPGAPVIARPTSELPGYGFGADRKLQLEIRALETGSPETTAVRGILPRHLLPSFETALDRGVTRYRSSPPVTAELARAREFSSAGELGRARHHRDHAALATTDPTLRALVMRQVTTPDNAEAARRHARERLAAHDLSTARMLLHTARRTAPDPGIDYELLWQLHRQDEHDLGALANALLAREFDEYADTIAILELQNSGLTDLVDRMATMSPQLSPMRGIQALPAATPGK